MSSVEEGEILYLGQVSSPRPMIVARKWSLLRTWRLHQNDRLEEGEVARAMLILGTKQQREAELEESG